MTHNSFNQSANNLVIHLEQSADEAWKEGFSAVQDICLILAESLRALSDADETTQVILSLFNEWPDLLAAYKKNPSHRTLEIMNFLRQPDLGIGLGEDELEMIESQLAEGNGKDVDSGEELTGQVQDNKSIEDYAAEIGQFADVVALDGLFGLQDTCLLLVDALTELSQAEDKADLAGIAKLISGWSTLIEAYKHKNQKAAAEMLHILRQPALNIPLSEEEFENLEKILVEELPESPSQSRETENAQIESIITNPDNENIESSGTITAAAQEILIMMVSQIDDMRNLLIENEVQETFVVAANLSHVGYMLENFGTAAETAGLSGLSRVCGHVSTNINQILEQKVNPTEDQLNLIRDWLSQVKEYLLDVTDSSTIQQLVFLLCDNNWTAPISMEEAAELLMKLRADGSDVQSYEESTIRKQTADSDDISLELPDDVNQELLDLLLQELPIQTQQFSETIQRIKAGGNAEDILLAQRIAHTLKGSANTVGIKAIAVLTHNLEDILTACSREERMPTKSLANALVNASDCLEGMSEALLGQGDLPTDAQNVLQEILDWANRIDREGLPKSDETVLSDVEQSKPTKPETVEKTKPDQAQTTMVRVPSDQIENLFRYSGENIILNSQAEESVRRLRNQLKLMQVQFALLLDLGNELERLIDLRDLSGRVFGSSDTGFDALEMDQYNELHTASRRMAESAIDAREISLDIDKELDSMNEILGFQQSLVIDAQQILMQTRLVPISTIVSRLQRSLRQTCRLTNKECDLSISGENILIDGDTLNAMVDPLMHVLRNAVDHGIEAEEEREAVGKPNKGSILFEFDRDGNDILLRCRDDGRGLDYGAIRAAAEKRGVLQPGQDVTEDELKRFILQPNFSTRTVTTQTSGRGVGMDVVRSQIVEMGGSLALNSIRGQGLTVEIRVPLPLSLTYALITHVGRYRVAIATKGITQIIYSSEGDLVELDGRETLLLEGDTYPTERLDRLLGTSAYPVERLNDILHVTDKRKNARSYGAILLVQNEDKMTAVLISPIVSSLDVVIKGMGQYVSKIPGYIGATILGDGTVTPVLDIPELLRAPTKVMQGMFAEPLVAAEPVSKLPVILVVDDSLSQRRALEQLLTDAGFRVRTARDGIEAAEILASFKPDIVITDLEMPRMNGIELAAHIRTQERIKTLPVIMITSRTTQKHKMMAQNAGIDYYLTKPVRDVDLLLKISELLEQSAGREQVSA
jgi:chemosensory pili system protein ChpA (sensor histidine kinase/response regulator)